MLTSPPQGHAFALKLGSVRNEVRVVRFHLREGLSSIPRAEVELVCRVPDLSFDDVMDQDAALTILDRKEVPRAFCGLVSGFAQGDTGFHWTAYRAVIEAPLHRLQYRSDSRIFQQMGVQDILTQVLNDGGVSQHKFSLTEDRPPREYCVQYRESDYDFFARLCAEEGLVFFHSYADGVCTLEITDRVGIADVASGLDGAVTYKSAGGGIDPDMPAFIQRFEYQENLRAGNLAQRDYWFKKPLYFWDKEAAVNTGPLQGKSGSSGQDLNLYDGYSRGHHEADDKTAARYATYRLEAHRSDGAIGKGRSTVAPLCPGFAFAMDGFAQDKLNQNYLITQIIHEGHQPQALDQDAPEAATDYHNRFEAIPEGIEWRADHYWHSAAPRKPRVDGPQLARVVGPSGEEIFCDDYGRVKLQFPWDRHGKGDENSSCWVRVSQLWAGTKYGGMAIPRIGQEVIVEFLDGDIDQPIITGRTYNAHNLPPYELPVNKTRTTIKSDTHKGSGYNELRFEDEAGREEVYLHSQRDLTAEIEHDEQRVIKNSSIEVVGSQKIINVGGDMVISTIDQSSAALRKDILDSGIKDISNLTQEEKPGSGSIMLKSISSTEINSGKNVHINAAEKVGIGGDGLFISSHDFIDIQADSNLGLNSTGEISIDSDGETNIISDQKITLVSGESKIEICSVDGVRINGVKIRLN